MLPQFSVTAMAPHKSSLEAIKLRNAIIDVHFNIEKIMMYPSGMVSIPIPPEMLWETPKPPNINTPKRIPRSLSRKRANNKSSAGKNINLNPPGFTTDTTSGNYDDLHLSRPQAEYFGTHIMMSYGIPKEFIQAFFSGVDISIGEIDVTRPRQTHFKLFCELRICTCEYHIYI